MKNLTFSILISLLTLFSCKKPIANFTEPQPSDKKNILHFPKKILGDYSNPELGFRLTINSNLITRTYSSIDTISSKEFKTAEAENIKLLSKISDSLYIVEFNIKDTLFSFKKGDVLRKLNQNYFLNVKNSDNNWNVTKLNFKHNFLTLSEIVNKTEIVLLNDITNQTSTDSIYPKTYSINKKQFKEFVKKNGFSESEIYIKQ